MLELRHLNSLRKFLLSYFSSKPFKHSLTALYFFRYLGIPKKIRLVINYLNDF